MSAAAPLPEQHTCRLCGRALALTAFERNGKTSSGWETICHACVQQRRDQHKREEPPVHLVGSMRAVWQAKQEARAEASLLADLILAIRLRPARDEERQAVRDSLKLLLEQQRAAWEQVRQLEAEFKLACIAEMRPEQLKQYGRKVRKHDTDYC